MKNKKKEMNNLNLTPKQLADLKNQAKNRQQQAIENNVKNAYKDNVLSTMLDKPYHSHEKYETDKAHKKRIKKLESGCKRAWNNLIKKQKEVCFA